MLSALLALPEGVAWLAVSAAFVAGMVRGFSGFGLSAVAMAVLAPFVPPISLIPVFWFLETSASVLLMRGGWADADRRTAIALLLASSVAFPLGLMISQRIDPALSKTVALSLLLCLSVAQIARLRLPVLATRRGTVASGAGAGLATGLAGVGGMVIALYTLVRDLPPRTMRGTLNIYLLGAGIIGFFTHLAVGTMTAEAAQRGLLLSIPALLGVLAGRAFFVPRWERLYKPLCLGLVIALAAAGLLRLGLGG